MTIYDIVKKAGVSASTVSRVINEAARGLVTQSSKNVGILIEDIRISHHTL
jgi:LacI family transcriptional regulator